MLTKMGADIFTQINEVQLELDLAKNFGNTGKVKECQEKLKKLMEQYRQELEG